MTSVHLELICNAPRADLLSFEQARQLHLELRTGHAPTPDVPPSITNTLAIIDTGCATSMAPSDDFFEKGSLYKANVNVIGAGGGLKLNERGTLRYPMESDRYHGIFKFNEEDSIKNANNCPYVLIAIGRASFEMGASLCMPVGGGNGTIAFRGGITVTVHNRKVLALRPLGYKAVPASDSRARPDDGADRHPDSRRLRLLHRFGPASRKRRRRARHRARPRGVHRVPRPGGRRRAPRLHEAPDDHVHARRRQGSSIGVVELSSPSDVSHGQPPYSCPSQMGRQAHRCETSHFYPWKDAMLGRRRNASSSRRLMHQCCGPAAHVAFDRLSHLVGTSFDCCKYAQDMGRKP